MSCLPKNSTSLDDPKLSTMPEEALVRILQFVDDTNTHQNILAFEMTCHTFRDLLQDDKVWSAIITFPDEFENKEFMYQPTNRERAFLGMTIHNIREYQKGDDNLLLKHLAGTSGVRRLALKLLNTIKPRSVPILEPTISDDAVTYLADTIQYNMIYRLERAMLLASGTASSENRYPSVTASNLRLLDNLFRTNHGVFENCSIANGHHVCKRLFAPTEGLPDWSWPRHDCRDINFLGDQERSKLVRALAYRAGIAKMSGKAFSVVSTEILHDMAGLLSLACDKCDPHFPFSERNYVITPQQIKEAANMIGMRPALFDFENYDDQWDVNENDEIDADEDEEFLDDYGGDDAYELDSDMDELDSDSARHMIGMQPVMIAFQNGLHQWNVNENDEMDPEEDEEFVDESESDDADELDSNMDENDSDSDFDSIDSLLDDYVSRFAMLNS